MQTKLEMVREYYDVPARSQSELKALASGLSVYRKQEELYFREKPHFYLGQAVDASITMPEHVDDLFYISANIETKEGNKITSAAKRLWDNTWNNPLSDGQLRLDKLEDYPDEVILSTLDAESYNVRWKAATRIEKFRDAMQDWWTDMIKARGKQILSTEEYLTVTDMMNRLQSGDFTHELMYMIMNPDTQRHLEIRTQVPLMFEYKTHNCKALLDVLIMDHNSKTYSIIDIKTTSDEAGKFYKSFKRFRYDVQMSWYELAMSEIYPGYTREASMFLVVSNLPGDEPLIYEFSDKDRRIGRWGAYRAFGELHPWQDELESDKRHSEESIREEYKTDVLGFEQMLYLWEWHNQHNEWLHDRWIVEQEGRITDEIWR